MRFKNFLNESSGTGRSKLDIDKALSYMDKNCGDYLGACAKARRPLIFRGEMSSGATFEVADSRKFIRKSANTYSWYNMWIDNSQVWSKGDYPKRLSSFICSSRFSDDYGTPKIVIPADTCKIGLCPEADIWLSFDTTLTKLCGPHSAPEVDEFQRFILNTWRFINDEGSNKSLPDIKVTTDRTDLQRAKTLARGAYADLKKELTECTLTKLIEKMEDIVGTKIIKGGNLDDAALKDFYSSYSSVSHVIPYGSFYKTVVPLIKGMHTNGIKNLAQAFDFVLDPKKNNFKCLTPREVEYMSGERELWVGGECMMIDVGNTLSPSKLDQMLSFFNSRGINIDSYF